MQEEEVVKKAQKDKKAFDYIYKEYYPKIYGYINSYVKNKENAEDLTSETFEKAIKGIDGFQWEGVSIQSWLYRIARNTINDFYRKSYNRKPNISMHQKVIGDTTSNATLEDIVESGDTHIEVQLIQNEDEQRLYTILMEFEEKDQYLLYYKYFENMTNKEIAKAMDMSETNVGTKLQRIREKLKHMLQI